MEQVKTQKTEALQKAEQQQIQIKLAAKKARESDRVKIISAFFKTKPSESQAMIREVDRYLEEIDPKDQIGYLIKVTVANIETTDIHSREEFERRTLMFVFRIMIALYEGYLDKTIRTDPYTLNQIRKDLMGIYSTEPFNIVTAYQQTSQVLINIDKVRKES